MLVSGQTLMPGLARGGLTTTTTTGNTASSPSPSVTKAPLTIVATNSSSVVTHFVSGTGSEQPSGGTGGRGAVAVSAGMAGLQIEANIARVKAAGIGGRANLGGVRLGQRKRSREDAAGGSGGGRVGPPPPPPPALQAAPPAPVVVPPPGGPIFCPVCRRDDFPSRQSLSGHMKTHPERNWRGINPPPTFDPVEFGDALAQFGGAGGGDIIVGAAGGEEAEAAVTVEEAETAEGQDGNVVAAAPEKEVFDLNKSPEKEAAGQASSSAAAAGKIVFDLNRSPSPPQA